MKHLKNIKLFESISSNSLIQGHRYKLIPNFSTPDDEDQEEENVEVVTKYKDSYLLKDIQHDFTYTRNFGFLKNYKIEEIE